ncbi:MAG: TPM domain-containing protein, partial [Cyanobacteria bacterium J06626_26]
MSSRFKDWLQASLWGSLLVCYIAFIPGVAPAHAYNNPELLPDEPTMVIDLAKILTNSQEDYLNEHLPEFEA